MCAGTSAKSRTIAAQNSTLVSSTRSGRRSLELGERGLLERLGDLVARGVELLGRAAQHAGARVLGAVDAVAEAHQPLAAVEQLLDVRRRVAVALLDLLDHAEHARRRTAVQRAGHRADGAGERGGHVGAGRGDDAGGEGGGVHAVLGGRRPVGVDRVRVLGVGLAAPADQEPLGEGLALVDLGLGDDRLAEAARRLGGVRQHHDGDAGQVEPGLLVGDVVGLAHAEHRREHRDRGLHVGADVTGVDGDVVGLGRRQAGGVGAVDEEAPDVLEGHAADEVLDVDAAVAQRGALLVGLGDLGLERDDTFEAVLDLGHATPS